MSRPSVPPVHELRRLTVKSEAIYGRIPWISKHFIHPYVSIHVSHFLLRAGFRGIQVTFLMAFLALSGTALFFVGGEVGYIAACSLMLISWILDHSDGEVRRYLGEDSNLGVYLDRFTHRVSYPLMHLGMGVSLFQSTGDLGYVFLGALVAYFYQLGVSHALDKALMAKESRRVERFPLKALREAMVRRAPALATPVRVAVGGYGQLTQNYVFFLALIASVIAGKVEIFYLAFGALVMGNWVLTTVLDFGLVFRERAPRTASAADEPRPASRSTGLRVKAG